MNIVDLFSGAGGLTFGFYYNIINGRFVESENDIIFANEFDESAAAAFNINFPDIDLINCDIRDLTENMILEHLGEKKVDIIIGGPPCQSFSTIGKRRYDDKAKLYHEFRRVVKIIRPKMFLFENVKGILSMKDKRGNSVISNIRSAFSNMNDNLGYHIINQTLDAVNFGVPQHRERVFIIGIRNDVNIDFNFANIKNRYDFDGDQTIEQAISDFPPIQSGEEATIYLREPVNDYQRLLRNNNQIITNHQVAVHSNKLQCVMNYVVQGEGRLYFNRLVSEGLVPFEYTLTSGYKNTYGRLVANQPSTTITNNMTSPSCLRCIHYNQNRTISPREAARIQSFPDTFQFAGGIGSIKKQIGNAVPPLLAMNLARYIEGKLEVKKNE